MIHKIFGALALAVFSFFARAQNNEIIKNYINLYAGIAVEEMQRTGVPAAIKLAQGVHETMAGQSPLVLKSNNHFGIKCKAGYQGPYVLHDDDRPRERFMKYQSADQSYKDHSDFLKHYARYAFLFQLDPTDYPAWAKGLKKAGYASNPKYAQLLINIIEKYNLDQYTLMGLGKIEMCEEVKNYFVKKGHRLPDNEVAEPDYPDGDFLINNTKVVYVKAGTSLDRVAEQYNVPINRLYDFNDFGNLSEIAKKGGLLYLQLKRTTSEKADHEVKKGERMFDIAQKEGIRLESILKYNNLKISDIPPVGSKLKLQEKSDIALN